MLWERRSECCEEIQIGGWCCMEPEALRWEERLRNGRWDRAWCCSSGCGQCGTGVLPDLDDRAWACSEQAHGDISARTDTTDSPEGPQGAAGIAWNGDTGRLQRGSDSSSRF
ncbi:uncharacterized protein VK521_000344 [Ammospiza maritima maritima]